ncbi:MAG: hypothetical protein Q8859_07035, partial [Bacteroidota bacterium]|nr:hypothetical protein [Bacteroidota bacterium]
MKLHLNILNLQCEYNKLGFAMKKIFEQISLGKLVVKNRLVRSATFEYGGAENGVITPLLKNVHEELAKGGVGLIITGMMATEANACISPGMVRVDLPSFIPQFTEIVNSV